jgi:nicotinamide riboside transporter PnuC
MGNHNHALAINIAGTVLGVAGAILNAVGSREAFPVWITSNVLLFVLFFGIWRS